MRIESTRLAGLCVVELERLEDERGFFARSFCAEAFREHGLAPAVAQCNVSFNRHAATLRGMHMQIAPHAEAKLVRATRGRVFDVALDLRPDSATFRQWLGFELSAANHRALYLPEGFAHGFVSLEDESELLYQMSCAYAPECQRGFRWDDPAFGIDWPVAPRHLSPRDRSHSDFDPSSLAPCADG